MLTISSILANLTFVSQNTNSLNVSTQCPKQIEKIESIIESKADIIFLSDIRLNNSNNLPDMQNYFLNSDKHYDFFLTLLKLVRE